MLAVALRRLFPAWSTFLTSMEFTHKFSLICSDWLAAVGSTAVLQEVSLAHSSVFPGLWNTDPQVPCPLLLPCAIIIIGRSKIAAVESTLWARKAPPSPQNSHEVFISLLESHLMIQKFKLCKTAPSSSSSAKMELPLCSLRNPHLQGQLVLNH